MAILGAVLGVAGAWWLLSGGRDDPARTVIERYVSAWSSGDDDGAAALTSVPGRARRGLRATRAGMDGGRVRARIRRITSDDGAATAVVDVAWTTRTVAQFGYRVELVAQEIDGRPRVRWRERNVHPALKRTTRLGTVVEPAERGRILDRDGRALVKHRPTVDIAVEVDRVDDPRATAAALASLVGVDAAALADRIAAAPSGRFVPVITLRRADYRARASDIEAVPAVSVASSTAPLAPSRGFAQATLGTVGPATAEQIAASAGTIRAGDVVGKGGLQARFDDRLTGVPLRAVVVRDRSSGLQERVLERWPGRSGQDVRVRLDLRVQRAAEQALKKFARRAALVAIEPGSGDILAVANRPLDDGFDRALLGTYPPGSTFKVVSTAALLRAGLSPDQTVECPPSTIVGGRAFRNFEGSAQGAVPFSVDFAESCNTAFVSLTGTLAKGALPAAAADFGFNRHLRPGVPVARSSAPEPADEVGEAAAMIGQDRILASPLAMAGVAGAVQDGRWRAPRLIDTAPAASGPPLPEAPALRSLMRDVILTGTGEALAGLAGEVIGKSGTAEYGGGDPPPTHAWFIASRPDVAVAVLVEGGRSGGAVAAPIARRFLEALP